jgi:hypothetical protein
MPNSVSILSKAATEEILGDELCFIVAFGKNGEIIPYLHNGVEADSESLQNFNPMDYIDVNFKIPEEQKPQVMGLLATPETSPAVKIMTLANRCRINGQWVTCNGFPCP